MNGLVSIGNTIILLLFQKAPQVPIDYPRGGNLLLPALYHQHDQALQPERSQMI